MVIADVFSLFVQSSWGPAVILVRCDFADSWRNLSVLVCLFVVVGVIAGDE